MSRANAAAVHALLLLAWGSFMTWLLLSGEVYRFIGPRTLWVVAFGAATFVLAGVCQIARIKSSPRRLPYKELGGLSVFLAPIIVLVLMPGAGLGSQAASRKATGGVVSAAGNFAPIPQPGEKISFEEISFASNSEAYAARLGIADGYPVKLIGFVTHSEDIPAGMFALTRFTTFCCAADAVPYSVTIDPATPQDFPDDTWLSVSGSLLRQEGKFVVLAEDVTEVAEPKNPYS